MFTNKTLKYIGSTLRTKNYSSYTPIGVAVKEADRLYADLKSRTERLIKKLTSDLSLIEDHYDMNELYKMYGDLDRTLNRIRYVESPLTMFNPTRQFTRLYDDLIQAVDLYQGNPKQRAESVHVMLLRAADQNRPELLLDTALKHSNNSPVNIAREISKRLKDYEKQYQREYL